jgi:YVTN family beta-propeller protein
VTINPAGTEVWICGASGDGIIVVDAINHTILQRISLTGQAENPVDIAFNSNGNTAYVAGRDSNSVAVIDTATYTVVNGIPISGPGKMAFSPVHNELFVAGWFTDELHRVNATTLAVTTFVIGAQLWDVVLSPPEDFLYITDRGSDVVHLFEIDRNQVFTSIGVDDDPWGIDVTPDGQRLVVANEDDHSVSIINLGAGGSVTAVPLPADADPRDVDLSPDGSLAWVPSGDIAGNDVIYVIDVVSAALADSVTLGNVNPNSIAVGADVAAPALFIDGFESVSE